MADRGPLVGPLGAVEPGAVEMKEHPVARADAVREGLQLGPGNLVTRLLVPEIEEHRVADQALEREAARVEARAVVMVGELDVRAAVRRHPDILQYVPGVGAAPILGVALVGEERVQLEVVFLLPRKEKVAEVHEASQARFHQGDPVGRGHLIL